MPAAFLSPVTRTTLTADIYRKMVSHLIRGDWQPGMRIPAERELCQMLGVGRASLREALKALEIIGMIEIRLGDGTYVCKRSEFLSRPLLWAIASSSEPAATLELIEARSLIEVELAGLAADRATREDLKQLGENLNRMEGALQNQHEFLQADIDFHLTIADAAHNSILTNALNLIRNLLQRWISRTLAIEGVPEKAFEQHKQVFMAIAKKDSSAARSAMQIHLGEMAKLLIESQEKEQADNRSIA